MSRRDRRVGETIRVSDDRNSVRSPGSPFDVRSEEYDRWYDDKGRFAFLTELAAVRPLLPDLEKPWLEIGVGTGRFAEALGIPQGIDPSEELLQLARSRSINVLWGEGEETAYRAGTFGTVFLLTTWAFLPDRQAVLRECQRILKPGGRVVNGFLDREGKWGRGYTAKGREGHPLFSRARFAVYPEVVADFEQAGYRIERTVSALFLEPGKCDRVEEPQEGYVPGASFVVLVARAG